MGTEADGAIVSHPAETNRVLLVGEMGLCRSNSGGTGVPVETCNSPLLGSVVLQAVLLWGSLVTASKLSDLDLPLPSGGGGTSVNVNIDSVAVRRGWHIHMLTSVVSTNGRRDGSTGVSN